jgi:hypothetical protein
VILAFYEADGSANAFERRLSGKRQFSRCPLPYGYVSEVLCALISFVNVFVE